MNQPSCHWREVSSALSHTPTLSLALLPHNRDPLSGPKQVQRKLVFAGLGFYWFSYLNSLWWSIKDGESRVRLRPQLVDRTSQPYHKSELSVTAKVMAPVYIYVLQLKMQEHGDCMAWLQNTKVLVNILQKMYTKILLCFIWDSVLWRYCTCKK